MRHHFTLRTSASILIAAMAILRLPGLAEGDDTLPVVGTPADLQLVEDSLSFREDTFSQLVLGEIRNVGAAPAVGVIVKAAVLGETGEIVEIRDSAVYYSSTCGQVDGPARAPCVAPGEVMWFRAAVDLDVPRERLEFVATGAETDRVPVDIPLELVGELTVADGIGALSIEGEIRNSGDDPMVGVGVSAVVRDPTGALLDVSPAFVFGRRIGGYGGGVGSGETASFMTGVSASLEEYGSCQILVSGTEYHGGDFKYAAAGIAHQPGVNGTEWRSSLALANLSGADGHVRLRFIQPHRIDETSMELADGESGLWEDVVANLFGVTASAVGFLRIDADVPLTVTAVTSNQLDEGSYGQLMPTVTPAIVWDASQGGVLAPIRGGSTHRTNIGFVNPTDQSCVVSVQLFDSSGSQVADLGELEVPSSSSRQINDVTPQGFETGYAIVSPIQGGATWSFASVIDNATGDPTTVQIDPEMTINLNPWPFPRASRSAPWPD